MEDHQVVAYQVQMGVHLEVVPLRQGTMAVMVEQQREMRAEMMAGAVEQTARPEDRREAHQNHLLYLHLRRKQVPPPPLLLHNHQMVQVPRVVRQGHLAELPVVLPAVRALAHPALPVQVALLVPVV
jgi:hypothetical protein